MIQPPHRSVTRFFIPMIDVLTLLFCMFLLMPVFRENESLSQEEDTQRNKDRSAELEQELTRRQKELQDLYRDQDRVRALLADLQAKKREFLQKNLKVVVLDVSPSDGTLSFFDPYNPRQPPIKIASEAEARKLIDRERQEAGPLELFFVFQRPHDPQIKYPYYPKEIQTETYGQWFRGVACGGFVTQMPAGKEKLP